MSQWYLLDGSQWPTKLWSLKLTKRTGMDDGYQDKLPRYFGFHLPTARVVLAVV